MKSSALMGILNHIVAARSARRIDKNLNLPKDYNLRKVLKYFNITALLLAKFQLGKEIAS